MKTAVGIKAFLGVLLLCACSGAGEDPKLDGAVKDGAGPDATAVPATVQVSSGNTTVKITTSPLGLSLTHMGKELTAGASKSATDPLGVFSLGQADPFVESRFYDPSEPPDYVSWSTATRVTAIKTEGKARVLTLDNGSTLTIRPAASVIGVIRLDLAAAAPDAKKGKGPQNVLTRICTGVQPKEVFFGFGELFDGPSSRGVVRPMQIMIDTKIASGYNEVHVPVPLAISPRGWAMLVNDLHAGAFDVAKASKDHICSTFHTHKITAYLMTAKDPLELVERTVSLTARPALPPSWAFGPQQWRNVLKSQAELMTDASDMRKHKIPGSVVWIDNPWQTGYNTFEFDTKQFPDAKGAIAKLHGMGYKVLVWSTPYINTDQTAMYADAEKKGYFPIDTLGKTLAYKWGHGKGSLIDFSAPGATAYWQTVLKKVTALGIDGYKLDYGEEVVVALGVGKSFFRFYGGKTPDTMHREYPGLYHKTYFDSLPKDKGFLITRAGSVGEQRFNTCIWPGDLDADFKTHAEGRVGGLPAAISAGLSLSVSGYPFFGSDIGGYRNGPPTTEVLLRWAEYAALGTIMQLGGGGKNHNPWDTSLYSKDALAHYRTYARLHTDLFPTIYAYAVKAASTGRPVTRPLGMAFPADEKAWTRDFQYMLGDYLLVAPVIVAGAKTHKVYLPAGKWLHHWTRTLYEGPREVEVAAPLGKIPLFRAEGAIVARLAKAVDTLAPATDKTVVSYEDHKTGLLLELLPWSTAGKHSSLTLADQTSVVTSTTSAGVKVELTAGKQFTQLQLMLDWTLQKAAPKTVTLAGKALAQAASADKVAGCAGGCWFHDAAKKMLYVYLTKSGTLLAVP